MTFLELHKKIIDKCDSWDDETHEIVDQLYGMLQQAETDLEVLNLRIAKQWSKGSNLYTEKQIQRLFDYCRQFPDYVSDNKREQYLKDTLEDLNIIK
jgi:hypothetical protein